MNTTRAFSALFFMMIPLISGCDSKVNADEARIFTLLTTGQIIAPETLTEVEGLVFFTAFEAETGEEPWVSDGTPEGTKLLKDIWPGTRSSRFMLMTNVEVFVFFEDWVYFFADDGRHGRELWRTDGTEEGTELFMDFWEGSGGVQGAIEVSDDKLYIWTSHEGPSQQELWVFE